MSDIKERLKLIREGSIDVSDDIDDEFIKESAYDIFLISTELNESSSETGEELVSSIIKECSLLTEASTSKNKKGIGTKLIEALRRVKYKFNPLDGIKQIRLVRFEIIANRPPLRIYSTDPASLALGSLISLVLSIFSKASKYDKLPLNVAESYLAEAKAFRTNLDILIKKTEDVNKAKKFKYQYDALGKLIIKFEKVVEKKRKRGF